MENLTEEKINIRDLIFIIRDKQVMLDSDVAMLYGYETKVINQTVRRNIKRFPEEFCFRLTEEEYEELLNQREKKRLMNWSQFATSPNLNEEEVLRSQIVTLKTQGETKFNEIYGQKPQILKGNSLINVPNKYEILRSQFVTLKKESGSGKHRKYLPYAFTEQGIAMLSGLLKNDIAIKVSINIMNAFVEMRKFINANKNLFERVVTIENKMDTKFLEHDLKFDELFDYMHQPNKFTSKIFFGGQIYDAYSLLIDLIKQAKKSIVIIDNYLDKTILDILSKKIKNCDVLIITTNKCKLTDLDIDKFNKQYPSLKIEYSNNYHDRFIIIDETVYHCGAYLKDLGNKVFAINKMNDKILLDKLNEIFYNQLIS